MRCAHPGYVRIRLLALRIATFFDNATFSRMAETPSAIPPYSRIPSQITVSVDAETIGAMVFIHNEFGRMRSAERS